MDFHRKLSQYKTVQILMGLMLNLAFMPVAAEPLSERALFVRCYNQIVGERPSIDHPMMLQVTNGSLGALAACEQVLDAAQFVSGDQAANSNDIEVRKTIRNFHRLHSTWFNTKDFRQITSTEDQLGSRVRFDATTPALYYTRSLFSPATDFSSVVTSNTIPEAVREIQSPNLPIIELNRRDNGVLETVRFDAVLNPFYAPRGWLIGVRNMPTRSMLYRVVDNEPDETYDHEHRGGGIMGDPTYLTMNLSMSDRFQSNLATMPRAWSRAIFSDLMCRDLPVLRQTDANPLVVANADLGFRRTASCVSCHATMDQQIGVIRNIRYRASLSRFIDNGIGFNGVVNVATNEPSTPNRWPASADNDYAHRPLDGQLFYRGFAGNLVNERVNSLQDMGNEIAQNDEVYVCAAKRYYQYLTGIEANIRDIADPAFVEQLTSEDQFHRNTVISLGRSLRTHQNSLRLIKDIMNLNHYRESNFGVEE